MGCPGYAAYKIHGNGLVDVNGVLPAFSTDSSQARMLQRIWKKYGTAIQAASQLHGVPVSWILGVIAQESGGNPTACSPCSACAPQYCEEAAGRRCCAFGLMQFTAQTARTFQTSPENILGDATHAIERGAALLSQHLRNQGGDLVKALALYNSGSLRCGAENTFGYFTNHDYPFQVVKLANTAVQLDLRNVAPGTTIAVLGLAVAGLIYWKPETN